MPILNRRFPVENKVERTPLEKQWDLLAKHDYEFYLTYVHRGFYMHGRHTKLICNALDKVEKGEIDRLILCLPPRHSKSMTVSETFPSYFIGRNPARRVIEVSYGDRLAKRFGRLNKQKIKEFGRDIFNIALPEWGVGVSSSSDWGVATIAEDGKTLISQRGGMLSTGIGGSITGEGADLLLIDDPIKNREEAYSITYRDKIWEEWKNTLRTRLQPNGAVIIILTRWHEDDLVGRLLNPRYREDGGDDKDRWKIISLAALCDSDNDLLGRKVNETLWPEYGFDKKWADQTKNDVGSTTWSALYQQRPSAVEGQLIKRSWWQEYNHNALPEMQMIVQSWDCAFEESGDGSYSVCTTWGKGARGIYLIDVYRRQMEFPELIRQMKLLYSKYNPSVVVVEYAASGKPAYQSLKMQTGIPLMPITVHKSKVVRLDIVSPMIEAGRVFLPDTATWLHDYLEEMSMFPNGENDDQVDSTSQALSFFQQRAEKWIVTSDEYEEKKKVEPIIDLANGLPIDIEDISVEDAKLTREERLKVIFEERYGYPMEAVQ